MITTHNIQPTAEEQNLLFLLDTIIHFMMAQESFDEFENKVDKEPASFFRSSFKMRSTQLYKDLEPIISSDYAKVYSNGSEETQNIILEYEIFIRYIALAKIPQNAELQQISKAYNENPKLIGSISKKVVKSSNKKSNSISKKEKEFLHLLDYTVNLVFLESYMDKLVGTKYPTVMLRQRIASVLREIGPIIKQNFHLVFHNEGPRDLIAFYREFIEFMGDIKIYEKIGIAQLIEAWNIDKKSFTGAINKVLN